MDSVIHIHLEGMDLAGKTTACHDLFTSLDGECQVMHNSLCLSNPVYELADRLRKEDSVGADALGHVYVAALAVDLERYAPPRVNTIQDSTIILRSLAYHSVAGTPFVVDAMKAMLPRHPRFTRSFVLTANLEVRRQRLDQRRHQQADEIAPDDLLILNSPDRFHIMEQTLVSLAREHFDAVVIDTSNLSESAVVQRILRALPSQ